jgi:hypothetical protein
MKRSTNLSPRILLVLVTGLLLWPALCTAAPASGVHQLGAAGIDLPRGAPHLFPDRLSAMALEAEGQIGGHATEGLLLAADARDGNSSDPSMPERYVSSFSTARAHKYMGYGTIGLAAIAALSSSNHDFHRGASYAALWLAGATCATGVSGFRGFVDFTDGFSAADVHALLGAIGTVGFAATLVTAEADGNEKSHSGIGSGGAIAMGLSVIAIHFEW